MNMKTLSAERRIEELENEVAQLTIVLEAMIEQLCDKDAMTREELAAKISEIDLRDGVADGRMTKMEPEVKEKKRPKLIIPE